MSERDISAGDRHKAPDETESSWLFLVLAGVAALLTGFIYAILIVCYILMVRDPGYGFWPPAEVMIQEQPLSSGNPPDDPDGRNGIKITGGRQAFFYRKNQHVGNILVLTGEVRNDYPEARGFIKVRGYLLSSNEKPLAEQVVYAGNFLTEDELANMPMSGINEILTNKSGRDNSNVSVQPGAKIRFMMIFDNIPDGTEQYRIHAVGSEPANR